MRFAESSGTRAALVLSTLVTAGALALAWPAAAKQTPRSPVRPMHGCGAGHRVAQVAPPPAPTEDPYVVTLRSARGEFERCLANHPDVQVRLTIDIATTGRVDNVEVKTVSADLANVDLHIVKCVQTAVSPLRFPVSADPERISTFLKP